ncbi:MAG: hypothetical protein Q8Q39_02830 [bacterium]|nr:hypothetical protein [bacterium]
MAEQTQTIQAPTTQTASPRICKLKICVSGAAETGDCAKNALENAKIIGREIARQGAVLVTGATTGAPYWSAIGAKEERGISIGLSPASTEQEHVERYGLPTENFDIIIYTGFDYSGRNLLLTRSSDAVIIVCGRIGTLNEFTIAFEDHKPIGILTGSGQIADLLSQIIETAKREHVPIIFDDDPKRLVDKLIEVACELKGERRGEAYFAGRG